MKKIILLLSFLIGFILYSSGQGTVVEIITDIPQDTLFGLADDATIYSPYLDQYWDYSLQLEAIFYGSGDSANFEVVTSQTNDPDQATWTVLTTLTDTLVTTVTTTGLLIEVSDFQGLWMKHYLTNLGEDTVIVQPFVVKKQKRNRFF